MQILQIIIIFILVVFLLGYLFFRNVNRYILENRNNLIINEDIHKIKQFILLYYLQYLKLEVIYITKNIFSKKNKDELERIRLVLESFNIKLYKNNMIMLFKTNFKRVSEDLRGNFFGETNMLDYYNNLGKYISSLKF